MIPNDHYQIWIDKYSAEQCMRAMKMERDEFIKYAERELTNIHRTSSNGAFDYTPIKVMISEDIPEGLDE